MTSCRPLPQRQEQHFNGYSVQFSHKNALKSAFHEVFDDVGHFASKFTAVYDYIREFYIHARSTQIRSPNLLPLLIAKNPFKHIVLIHSHAHTHASCGTTTLLKPLFRSNRVFYSKNYRRQPYSTGVWSPV